MELLLLDLFLGLMFLFLIFLIKINLDADMAFFNVKIDFLIIILMCHQPR